MKKLWFLLALLLPLLGASAQTTLAPNTDLTHLMSFDTWYEDQGQGNVSAQSSSAYETFGQQGFTWGKVISNFIVSQLEPGTYEVQFYAMACLTGRSGQTGSGSNIAQVFANNSTEDIEVAQTTTSVLKTDANLHKLTCYVLEDGRLEYGIKNIAPGGDWYTCENVKLTYLSGDHPMRSTVHLAVDAQDYGTCVAPFELDLSGFPSLEAYTIAGLETDGKKLQTTRLGGTDTSSPLIIPAYTPVVLYNTSGQNITHDFSAPTAEPSSEADIANGIVQPTTTNWLAGVLPDAPEGKVEAPNGCYVLQTHNSHTAFYLVDTTVAKPAVRVGRCYLAIPTQTETIKEEWLDVQTKSGLTQITTPHAQPTRSKHIYSPTGQRLQHAQRGINIIDGKKVIK